MPDVPTARMRAECFQVTPGLLEDLRCLPIIAAVNVAVGLWYIVVAITWLRKKTVLFVTSAEVCHLTRILLTWRIWWAPINASKWQMGFHSALKVLKSVGLHGITRHVHTSFPWRRDGKISPHYSASVALLSTVVTSVTLLLDTILLMLSSSFNVWQVFFLSRHANEASYEGWVCTRTAALCCQLEIERYEIACCV